MQEISTRETYAAGFTMALLGYDLLDKSNFLDLLPGIGIGDFLASFIVLIVSAKRSWRLSKSKSEFDFVFVTFLFSFILVAFVSSLLNVVLTELAPIDVFEPIRLLLYLLFYWLILFSLSTEQSTLVTLSFVFGVVLSGSMNLVSQIANPTNILTAGFVQVEARNLTGVLMSVTGLLSLLGMSFSKSRFPRFLFGIMFVASAVLSLFTFSLGAWLGMFIVICCAAIFALQIGGSRVRAVSVTASLLTAFTVVFFFGDLLWELVELKLATREGGGVIESNIKRLGNLYSAVLIGLEYPLYGVGPSNFALFNSLNKDQLGVLFLDNDNPHNAFGYAIASYGLIAFLLLVTAMLGLCKTFVNLIFVRSPLPFLAASVLLCAMISLLLLHMNLVLHPLTTIYLFAIVTGLRMIDVRHAVKG